MNTKLHLSIDFDDINTTTTYKFLDYSIARFNK